MGHGSQVASVVGTRNGVAPGVTLGAYRVFGCEGYVGDNVLIDAIDRAVRDGCDVINLSLASGSGYAETVSVQLSSSMTLACCCQLQGSYAIPEEAPVQA
jgi:subtilisin family serine protease